MTELAVNGGTIHYQEFGHGVPVVLTTGGRWAGYVQRVVATELAKDFRVFTWDRRNTDGKSDITIAGDASEADLWASDLAALIRALGLGPCYVGEYAGCRTTPILCLDHPDLVKGLMLAWPSGGEAATDRLPRSFYRQYIRAALRHGMQSVLQVDRFAGSIKQNPANRLRLLEMDTQQFVRQMAYWEAYFNFSADLPITGCRMTDDEWASIKIPASITGGMDSVHPTAVAQRLHKLLPNSQYHDPVATLDEWDKLFNTLPYPQVSDFQGERIAPVWRDFIMRLEA
jgi:pimeloyl-ACP methyl ester carboxylesterase